MRAEFRPQKPASESKVILSGSAVTVKFSPRRPNTRPPDLLIDNRALDKVIELGTSAITKKFLLLLGEKAGMRASVKSNLKQIPA